MRLVRGGAGLFSFSFFYSVYIRIDLCVFFPVVRIYIYNVVLLSIFFFTLFEKLAEQLVKNPRQTGNFTTFYYFFYSFS